MARKRCLVDCSKFHQNSPAAMRSTFVIFVSGKASAAMPSQGTVAVARVPPCAAASLAMHGSKTHSAHTARRVLGSESISVMRYDLVDRGLTYRRWAARLYAC